MTELLERVSMHRGCTGWTVLVRNKLRCTVCGHRMTVNGVAPIATRRMPPWRWHLELMDRRRARRAVG